MRGRKNESAKDTAEKIERIKVLLLESNMTYAAIGKTEDVTRQRVQQIAAEMGIVRRKQ